MAARAAMLLGAERVISIDRYPERLAMTERYIGSETIDYSATDVGAELRERTGGRGPDVCIEAVGMEAHGSGPLHVYDQVKQQLRLESDRPTAVREAIHACRKGGTVFVLGVFGGLVDKFPLGAVINKGLTVRGAQQHGQRYIPMLLDRIAKGELSTSHLVTHELSLEDGAKGYDLFKHKKDGCVRAVFDPTRPAR
jgi:threonine dehydrogenase-like Zn-dependent dehydrogenase